MQPGEASGPVNDRDRNRSLPASGRELAMQIERRQPKVHMLQKVSLFHFGRLTTGITIAALTIFLWQMGFVSHSSGAGPTIFFLVLAAPLLAYAIYQAVKLGLHGVAEFFCGLLHMPVGIIAGAPARLRNYNLVGLICCGHGRFDEALKYFSRARGVHSVFDKQRGSPFNERNRIPELLARMGRREEAWALALSDLDRARKIAADLPCDLATINLQVCLIVAARVLEASGRSEEMHAYLEEAAQPLSAENATLEQTALGSYAQGMDRTAKGDYHNAITSLVLCRDSIAKERVRTSGAGAKTDSELLGFSQQLAARCYLKTGNAQELLASAKLLESENQSEPNASQDKVNVDLARADLKLSEGKTEEALRVMETTITNLSDSRAPYDQLLVVVLEQYSETLAAAGRSQDAEAITGALKHLESVQKQQESSNKRLPAPTQVIMPSLSDSKVTVNRAVGFFVGMFLFCAYQLFSAGTHFDYAFWGIILALATAITAKVMYEQVHQRRSNFFTAQAVQVGSAVDIVLAPLGQSIACLRDCRIDEGPEEMIGRRLRLHLNQNLIFASSAHHDSKTSAVRARLYFDQKKEKVLAVETLGHVLTVEKEKPANTKLPALIEKNETK